MELRSLTEYVTEAKKANEAKKDKLENFDVEIGIPEKEGVNTYPVTVKERKGDKDYKASFDADENMLTFTGEQPEESLISGLTEKVKKALSDM